MPDYVLTVPDALLPYVKNGQTSAPAELEELFVANIGQTHFFIHARATLPLKDIDHGIGFKSGADAKR